MKKGGHWSEEVRKKISETEKGKYISPETKRKISEALKGKYIGEKNSMFGRTGERHPMFGKHHSPEVLRKMSKILKGKNKGEKCFWFGKHLPSEHLRKLSEAMKGKYVLEKHPLWQGGISFLPYSLLFNGELKQIIKKRDNYKCQNSECSGECSVLGIHHIDHNKHNCLHNNLITLCTSCNAKANSNLKRWEGMYREIACRRSTKYFTRTAV